MTTKQNCPAGEKGEVLSKHARRGHVLRTPPAWVWDIAIPDAADVNVATITKIECDGLINRAYGDQHGLALTYWQFRRKGKDPAAVQLTLYKGR